MLISISKPRIWFRAEINMVFKELSYELRDEACTIPRFYCHKRLVRVGIFKMHRYAWDIKNKMMEVFSLFDQVHLATIGGKTS